MVLFGIKKKNPQHFPSTLPRCYTSGLPLSCKGVNRLYHSTDRTSIGPGPRDAPTLYDKTTHLWDLCERLVESWQKVDRVLSVFAVRCLKCVYANLRRLLNDLRSPWCDSCEAHSVHCVIPFVQNLYPMLVMCEHIYPCSSRRHRGYMGFFHITLVKQSQPIFRNYFHDNWCRICDFVGFLIFWKGRASSNFRKIRAIALKLHTNILYRFRNFGIEFGQNRLERSFFFQILNFLRITVFFST